MNWQELIDTVNGGGHQILMFDSVRSTKTGLMYSSKGPIVKAYWIPQTKIRLELAWLARFDPFSGSWIFIVPPRLESPASMYNDVETIRQEPAYQQTLCGQVIRISCLMMQTNLLIKLNPAKMGEYPAIPPKAVAGMWQAAAQVEVGAWIIPPGPGILKDSDVKKFN